MENDKPLLQLLSAINSSEFESVRSDFGQFLKPYTVRKGRLLVDMGEVNSSIYFIKSGIIRSYYYKGSEDITSRLVSDSDIACVAESFFSQTPSDEVMETLDDCEVYAISYQSYRKLTDENPLVGRLIIRLLEQRLVVFCERVKVFKYLTVEQRIEYYLQQPYSLFRKIPDHYIATFLGTTPATFSRCLKKLNLEKE